MTESYHRHQRVESLIQEELNKLILRELEFSADLVTVTRVEVQKDLDYATIYASVLPIQKSEEVLKLLDKNTKRLQFLLTRKLNIKPMPQIRFKIDYGMEKAAEIEKTFIDLEKQGGNK